MLAQLIVQLASQAAALGLFRGRPFAAQEGAIEFAMFELCHDLDTFAIGDVPDGARHSQGAGLRITNRGRSFLEPNRLAVAGAHDAKFGVPALPMRNGSFHERSLSLAVLRVNDRER